MLLDTWEIHCKDCFHMFHLQDQTYDPVVIEGAHCLNCGSKHISIRSEGDNLMLRDTKKP